VAGLSIWIGEVPAENPQGCGFTIIRLQRLIIYLAFITWAGIFTGCGHYGGNAHICPCRWVSSADCVTIKADKAERNFTNDEASFTIVNGIF